MRKLLAVLAIVAVTAAALLAIPAFGATASVAVKDNKFGPRVLRVGKGTTVRWVWRKTRNAHNVVAASGPQRFRSKVQKRGAFAVTLRKKGVYRVICQIHANMKMRVIVR